MSGQHLAFDRLHLRLGAAALILLAIVVASSDTCGSDSVTHDATAPVGADSWSLFAQSYCIQCHGPEKQKGRVRLDHLVAGIVDDQSYGLWRHVVKVLATGEMPPEEAKRHPMTPEVAAVRSLIQGGIAAAEHAGRLTRPETPLKRLNRIQYRNTLRDLLGIETTMADPTRGFPDDRGGSGFDTGADDLKISDSLMENYLRAASQVIDEATFSGARPERIYRQYIDISNRYRLEGGIDGDPIGHEIYNHYDIERGWWVTPQECGHVRIIGGTPFTESGYYHLIFKAQSLYRDHPDITAKLREYSPNRSHQLAIRLLSPERTFPEIEHTVAIHDLPDNQIVDIDHEVWVPKNWRLQLSFDNGPACPLWVLHQELIGWKEIPTPPGATEAERVAIRKQNQAAEPKTPQSKEFMRTAISPRIRLHKMAIDGPYYRSWPPACHDALYGAGDITVALRAFSRRAFRREVPESALQPFLDLAAKDGYATAVKAMLCSPYFLYLYENDGRLSGDALACRLSYALTSSMPDSDLSILARTGKLSDPAVYDSQIERLLNSPASDDFSDSFVSQWLHLRNVDKMPPDEKKYPEFYHISHGYTGTRDAIVKEPVVYFRHLLAHNLPVSLLLDSTFTFMNDALADFYGVAGVDGSHFQHVALEPGLKRGGLFGMAAVLAASANGVDTSPVVRGIYVLDNLLGAPPEPPPPGIKLPQTDLRGTTTIRTILDRHRTDESCASCHRSIDPIGFALENFDAEGRWRTRYPNAPVDASGTLPNGRSFTDIVGFKKALAKETDHVAENLVRRLLTYCTGRTMGALDEGEIEELCAQLKAKGYGLHDLLTGVLKTRIFTMK